MSRQVFSMCSTVKDKITGFVGVVVGISDWLNGCQRIIVQGTELHDGKPTNSQTFDTEQLEQVDKYPKVQAIAPPSTDIALGSKVRDKITGAEGVVVAMTVWYTGERTMVVQPQKVKDNAPQDTINFDSLRAELVPVEPPPMDPPKRGSGGPMPSVSRPSGGTRVSG